MVYTTRPGQDRQTDRQKYFIISVTWQGYIKIQESIKHCKIPTIQPSMAYETLYNIYTKE